MLLEEEVLLFLRLGLFIVMVPTTIVVITLMMKHKKRGYGWILAHFVLFSICALASIRILETRALTSSWYNSLSFAWIGIVWAVSMCFFVLGLLNLSKVHSIK